ncbi:MAG: peptide chain release factor 1 [Candidatus Ancillula sp.]|jgi:peptide chain release factor 1|nr:peptide chain release factor 1 [Candidatus Ancillula sp.]
MTSEDEQFPVAQKALEEFADIEQQLQSHDVLTDQNLARRLGKRYSALKQVVNAYKAWKTLNEDCIVARDLARTDPDFEDEVNEIVPKLNDARILLNNVLIPRDEDDTSDVIVEIKAGAGGEESALFAGDLLRMYLKYSEKRGWKTQIMDTTETDIGGYKDVTLAIRNTNLEIAPADGVWANLKFEGGVHRVQRIPVTESSGRIHTSATGVYVYPELEEDAEIEIDQNDLRIDVFRAGGPGGQCVNTTDSAVRITHIPTGIVVSMQNEKSQIQNRAAALKVLKSRLIAKKQEEEAIKNSDMRLNQVRTADRSERIRTYNFPENRITDHRSNFKAYNLDQVLNGDLDAVINSCIELDEKTRLANA